MDQIHGTSADLESVLIRKDIVTTAELCILLGCSRHHVQDLISRGMPYVWDGRPKRFSWSLCAEWFRSRAATASN